MSQIWLKRVKFYNKFDINSTQIEDYDVSKDENCDALDTLIASNTNKTKNNISLAYKIDKAFFS